MSKLFTRQLLKQPRPAYSIKALRLLGMSVCEPTFGAHQICKPLDEYFRIRKTVFVDKLQWNINHSNGQETDIYDNEAAYYSIIQKRGQIAMAARGHRVGSSQPGSLIEALFELYPDLAISIHITDWDVTRLLLNPNNSISALHKAIGFRALFDLQRRKARALGCNRMLAVTNPRVPAHFAKIGLKTRRISDVVSMNENGSEIAVFGFAV